MSLCTQDNSAIRSYGCLFDVEFRVDGLPRWDIARSRGRRRFHSKKHMAERQAVVDAFQDALLQPGAPFAPLPHTGPVACQVEARKKRPKDWYPGKPRSSRPDAVNHSKLIGDTLNGIAWKDDSQLELEQCFKLWADEDEDSHLVIRLRFYAVPERPPHEWSNGERGLQHLYEHGTLLGSVRKLGSKWFWNGDKWSRRGDVERVIRKMMSCDYVARGFECCSYIRPEFYEHGTLLCSACGRPPSESIPMRSPCVRCGARIDDYQRKGKTLCVACDGTEIEKEAQQ